MHPEGVGIEMTSNHLTISVLQTVGFEEVWEMSRSNSFTWGYPAAILCGGIVLVLFSRIPRSVVRRTLKVATILGFGYIAFDFSAREIAEKWSLRHEWGIANREHMTKAQQDSLFADGANRTLGPLIYGFEATAFLAGIALIQSVARRLNSTTNVGSESRNQIQVEMTE